MALEYCNSRSAPNTKRGLAMRHRRLAAAAAVTVSLSLSMFSPALAVPKNPTERSTTEPVTGARLTISGEGDCAELSVRATLEGEPATTAILEYDITNDCRVSNIAGHQQRDTALVQPTSIAAGVPAVASESCNYIHSSQTLQDIINVDIAKHRLNTRRCWTPTTTWMTAWTAHSYTSVSWNHVVGSPRMLRFDTARSATAIGQSSGTFHTDWAWCNANSGWQTIELRNTNTSKAGGGYSASFWQNASCPGTHMATASKANTSPEW